MDQRARKFGGQCCMLGLLTLGVGSDEGIVSRSALMAARSVSNKSSSKLASPVLNDSARLAKG